ncbi:uncharacterized protein SETTUDRAFT_35625 [Exserohilum turcica Et28A]|uniref:DUF7730 domain-containing protein n=1 Tax=Exserohilum turcicum (strain 28A) TaxID=671987 RepID=R0JT50_EXST2|nr:uncharacterized protein SETTUDRAFT_35625 [Exserohilum turcica Et28A]EOA80699.1 hypothetical protein SETTUDRAFT_35625 [Exserohilum turcica Et28A]
MSSSMTSSSLFSRARAHTAVMPSPKKLRGFLALPGEIRNGIYSYYFGSEYHCEITAQGSQFKQRRPHTIKLWSGLAARKDHASRPDTKPGMPALNIVRFSGPLGLQTNWLGSPYALSLTCKQVHLETAAFLYSKTVFIFDAPKRILNFFNVVPSTSLDKITKLHFHYDTYGPPHRADHQVWQAKHSQSWFNACKAASKKLTGLQELQVWAQLHDSAPKFSLREKWITPLLQFQRHTRCTSRMKAVDDAAAATASPKANDTHTSYLENVQVHIRTRWSHSPLTAFLNNKRLAQASTELHVLYGHAVSLAIKGAKEEEAMAAFDAAWGGKYRQWRHHLQFAQTGW